MASSASSNEQFSKFSSHKRTHFDRHPSDFSYAVEDGDAELLDEVLQEMKVSERTAVLEMRSPRPGLWRRIHVADDDDFSGDVTPLITAVERGYLDCVKILLKYKADIEVRGSYESYNKCTPSFIAAAEGDLDVLRCLVENGADVNALTDDKWTPLMIASYWGHVKIVNFLFEHGANLDLQNEEGNTALHLAIFSIIEDEEDVPSEVADKLLSLGASQLCNHEGLTPLLLASSECKVSVVKDFIKRPECTKQQRIDALELLGASYPITETDFDVSERSFWSLHYIKQGMEERFLDPSCPFLKQPMEPIKAYQNRKESQTFEELAQIEGDFDAIIMEGLIIRERILGTNIALVDFMKDVVQFYNDHKKFDICIGLQRHIVEICKHCNTSVILEFRNLTETFQYMVKKNFPPIQKVVAEVLNEAILEYEEKREQLKDLELNDLLIVLFDLLQLLAVTVEDISTSVLLQRLCRLNPRDSNGNTLLHMAPKCGENGFWIFDPFEPCEFLCIKTIKLLLMAGINVNTINNNGDTPLHIAASFKPWSNDMFHLLTGMLEVLLDGGAHHDFVNNDGKTAMDVAQTDEACRILSENKTLELKCISARAVKKFGLPYLGLVPKILEKYISRH